MRLGDDPMWIFEESVEGMTGKGSAFPQYDIEWLENARDLSELSLIHAYPKFSRFNTGNPNLSQRP